LITGPPPSSAEWKQTAKAGRVTVPGDTDWP